MLVEEVATGLLHLQLVMVSLVFATHKLVAHHQAAHNIILAINLDLVPVVGVRWEAMNAKRGRRWGHDADLKGAWLPCTAPVSSRTDNSQRLGAPAGPMSRASAEVGGSQAAGTLYRTGGQHGPSR